MGGNSHSISRAVSRIKQRDTPAIAELKIALDTVTTNEPINEREGNKSQAALERRHAKSFREAIAKLAR